MRLPRSTSSTWQHWRRVAPIITVLGARMPRRRLLLLLMAMFTVFNGLTGLSPNYHWMLVFRFLAGLPHGAYFGVAALVASSLVPANRRTRAVGQMFLGLTVATIVLSLQAVARKRVDRIAV